MEQSTMEITRKQNQHRITSTEKQYPKSGSKGVEYNGDNEKAKGVLYHQHRKMVSKEWAEKNTVQWR